MAIQYYIDNIQLFKGFLLVEGWAFSGQLVAVPSLRYQEKSLAAEWTVRPRPDLKTVFADAPENCGFQLRAIVTDISAPEDIVVVFKANDGEVLVEKPAQAVLNDSYRPLAKITERFFECARGATNGTVLEIGARARSGIVRRSQFGDKLRYVGFDILAGENVDVVGDAHELSRYFDPGSFDFCYSVSVFEHLMWPWKVALELNAVMKVGGIAFIQSHPTWPKHEMPWDFFRFWDSGWRSLFCEATGFRVLDTVEALVVDLIPRGNIGNPSMRWEGDLATLASAVLAEKIAPPKVAWSASPPLDEFGKYPF
jgi:SAM-dependent methyltransferase